jgi:hypothetical protein
MPDLNLTDNAANLAGQLLDQLKADPESIAMAERATAVLAAVPIATIGATDDMKADLQNQWDAALAVLYSLASAGVEDAAHAQAAVQKRIFDVINVVLTDAIKVGFGALKLALV